LEALLKLFLPCFHLGGVGLPGAERLGGHELGCGHGAGRFDDANGRRGHASGWFDQTDGRWLSRRLSRERECAQEEGKKQAGYFIHVF